MITSLLFGNKKKLIIGGAVVIGLIALASASSNPKSSQPSLNGTPKKKQTRKKTAKLKV